MHIWFLSHTAEVRNWHSNKTKPVVYLTFFLDPLLALSLLTGVFVVEPEEASSSTRTLHDPDSLVCLSTDSWPV